MSESYTFRLNWIDTVRAELVVDNKSTDNDDTSQTYLHVTLRNSEGRANYTGRIKFDTLVKVIKAIENGGLKI